MSEEGRRGGGMGGWHRYDAIAWGGEVMVAVVMMVVVPMIVALALMKSVIAQY